MQRRQSKKIREINWYIELSYNNVACKFKKMHPTKKEISSALTRYNFVLRALGQIIDKVVLKNQGNNRWFIFSEKIANKYLNQAYTLQQLFKDDIYFIKDVKQTRFIDFSSLYSLLRVQLETYSVFYHLLVDKCEMEEKIIRFRLWELDGLRTIETYDRPDSEELKARLEKNKKDIHNCIQIIKGFRFFKNLHSEKQDSLIKYANWKFSTESLQQNDKKKWRMSINKMIMNTGLKESHFNDWYSFSSTHAHTSYWSVVQNDSLNLEEKITMEYVSIMQAVFVTSFFIKDFCRIYDVARQVFDSFTIKEREVIDSFNIRGRD